MEAQSVLTFAVEHTNDSYIRTTITVPASYVERLYHEAIHTQQKTITSLGFPRGKTPLEHLKTTHHKPVLEHLKELFLKHIVIDALYRELHAHKLSYVGEPQLISSSIDLATGAVYTFNLTRPQPISFQGWKFYSFRLPKRKNYRDIDRQVESFIQTEGDVSPSVDAESTIHVGSWVCFDLTIVNQEKQPLLPLSQTLWIKIGNEEIDEPFQELFVGRKTGEQFYSSARCLQEFLSTTFDTSYLFLITVKECAQEKNFSLEEFKNYFRLRTNKELHKKLIEVFSFRNDVSQRHEMVQEIFNGIFTQHEVTAPTPPLLRRQQELLTALANNPDYQVYRMQKDFENTVKKMAEKQLLESIIIDQLGMQENISVSEADVKQYLNLLKRPRTKAFIHFATPTTKVHDQEQPVSHELLKHHSWREKTLNYIIYHVTRS